MLSTFGALLLRAREPAAPRSVVWIGRGSIVAAFVTAACWVAVETSAIAGRLDAWPAILGGTLFGHLVLVRLGLLGLAAVAESLGWHLAATGLAGLAVASMAGHGHAWAMDPGPSWLLASELLHLLAAGAWVGGLLPLGALVARATARDALRTTRHFARMGTLCVLAIAGTALFQSSILIGSDAALVGTEYGRVALTKLALFMVLLAFAARHRFGLTPALAGTEPAPAKRALATSIAAEALVGLLLVLAAGLLSSLAPTMAMPM